MLEGVYAKPANQSRAHQKLGLVECHGNIGALAMGNTIKYIKTKQRT